MRPRPARPSTELMRSHLPVFLAQFVVISKTAGAVDIDKRALGGRYPLFVDRLRRFEVYHKEYYVAQNFG
jgi:hypothetical protein